MRSSLFLLQPYVQHRAQCFVSNIFSTGSLTADHPNYIFLPVMKVWCIFERTEWGQEELGKLLGFWVDMYCLNNSTVTAKLHDEPSNWALRGKFLTKPSPSDWKIGIWIKWSSFRQAYTEHFGFMFLHLVNNTISNGPSAVVHLNHWNRAESAAGIPFLFFLVIKVFEGGFSVFLSLKILTWEFYSIHSYGWKSSA